MLAIGLLISVIVGSLSWVFGGTQNWLKPSLPAALLIGLVWLTILFGCFFRALDVRAGGAVLARRFGAVKASDRSRHPEEKVLLNVVTEVGIASATEQPDVYVMRHEDSINAFVVGSTNGKLAIVVTQGTLDSLDRDQLQAVVAHEFGHIAQGDVLINMRLLIVLGGLLAVDEVGRLLVGRHPDELAHPGLLVGYLLRGIGSVGVLCGNLIRAAFSRQREFLADASAVQFTRNPFALAEALAIIRDQDISEPLHTQHAQEIAHLCFHLGTRLQWYRRLLASHPPIQQRIDTIEPHFATKARKKKKQSASVKSVAGSGVAFGVPMSYEVNISETGLSDRIMLLLPDASSCLAVIFALFGSDDAIKRKDYLSAIAFAYNQAFADQVQSLLKALPAEIKKDQLGIIEHATTHLRENVKFDNRQRLLKNLERLLVVEGEFSLMNYATLQLIRRKLDVEFPILDTLSGEQKQMAECRRVKTFDAMEQEFALLLSLMVESSGAPAPVLDREFQRVLKCYTQSAHPRRTGSEPGIIKELEAAFQTLYVQPKPIRQAFVQHCVEIMQNDGHIAQAEKALVDLFAASLGCEPLAA